MNEGRSHTRMYDPATCDSNPHVIEARRISSQSRYDHFDTLPYLSQHQHLRKRGELMGRTIKNIKFRIPEKPRKIKGFRNGGFPIATTISSQRRCIRTDRIPLRRSKQTVSFSPVKLAGDFLLPHPPKGRKNVRCKVRGIAKRRLCAGYFRTVLLFLKTQ